MSFLDTLGTIVSGAGVLIPGTAGRVVSSVGEGIILAAEAIRAFDEPDHEIRLLRAEMVARRERMRRNAGLRD